MGVKQSKFDGIYLPETPTGLKQFRYFTQTPKPKPLTIATEMIEIPNLLDPRSPSCDRTPIALHEEETFTSKLKQSMPAILRKKLLKANNYEINDPRSPSAELNRTPMIFEDGTERGLSLDDTFSDLLVETHTSANDSETCENSQVEELKDEVVENENKTNAENHSLSFISMASEEGSIQEHTPIVCMLQQPLDPRSPTYGVERTPIVLTDDMDEEELDQEMEDMLAKLSLHINSTADQSLLSFGALSTIDKDDSVSKPTNKLLERVRVPKKPARSRLSNTDAGKSPVPQIYEDNENIAPKTNNSKENNDIMEIGKRTPLSCVGNQKRLSHINKMDGKKETKHALTALMNLNINKSKDSQNDYFMENEMQIFH